MFVSGVSAGQTLVLGHRGLRGQVAENTPAAFAAALRAGADGVELDVRMTADGALVVRHDEDGLSEMSLAGARAALGDLATLHEALEAVRGAWCVAEVKPDPARTSRVCEAVARALAGRDRVLVSSFDPGLLSAYRALDPARPTALTVGFALTERDLDWALDEARSAGHAQLHLERSILASPLAGRLDAGGPEVVVWTVNDPAEALSLRERGVAAVITDDPEAIVRAYAGGSA